MIISAETKKYWEEADWLDLEKAESIKDLFVIAERVINRMPRPFGQVCGPITTGGLGTTKNNLEVFNNEIIKLQNEGVVVFDQMPFEVPMQRLKVSMTNDLCEKSILVDFYKPIFESGNISIFYFIKNWESSNGAKWEHNEAKKLGVEIKYL